MALRARMHPRNIYKIPPNFKELAIEYPEFRKYVKQELSGRITLDYNDRKAVKELTKLLLLKDFNLRVEINECRLIPRVPLCLNYVLWIEDLLSSLSEREEIRGIDVGTGSACIYSLLASTKGWKMLATEVDKVSFQSAAENVKRNNLNDKIILKFVENSSQILEGVIDDNVTYDFCMCNPPFFDVNEQPANRTSRRKIIQVPASYIKTDVTTGGGEIEFIKKLIAESQNLKETIKIYTTLVGKKSDFITLKKELKKINPVCLSDTEFCQGNTIRWGIAWSFSNISFEEINNKDAGKSKKNKSKILKYLIPCKKCDLNQACEKIQQMINDLKISHIKAHTAGGYTFNLKAYENTWSHQRQKNRLKQKKVKECLPDVEIKDESANATENSELCDSNDPPPNKRMKMSENNSPEHATLSSDQEVLVECLILVREENNEIAIEMSWLSGHKESVHQIFQYLKNNWGKFCKGNVLEETVKPQ